MKETLQFIQFALSKGLKIALIYCRVSDTKQADDGDSWEDQEKVCRLSAERQGYYVIRVFYESYTGTTVERPVWEQLLTFCKQLKGSIHAVFVRDLDRFNRNGVTLYETLKGQLAQFFVDLKDVPGIVQQPQNALEHLGIEYQWSRFSSSEMAEVVKNQADTDDRRRILIRLIGTEIGLARKGYWMRQAPHGYINAKTENHEGKKRSILIPDEVASSWYVKMYELRAEGVYNDPQIVNYINQMGFVTPVLKLRDRLSRKIIGTKGGKQLTVKQLQARIARPIYAGIIQEKWTSYQPIKAQFEGIVSIELWNKAQKGRRKIIKVGEDYKIVTDDSLKRKQTYNKVNPQFPYKSLVRCSTCNHPLMGSASTGKGGKRYPAYHCSRNHKRFAVSGRKMHETMAAFFKTLEFTAMDLEPFEYILRDAWEQSKQRRCEYIHEVRHNIERLEVEKKGLVEKIKRLSSPVVIAEFEKEIEELNRRIADARESEHEIELGDEEVDSLVHYSKYFLEHLSEWFLQSQNRQNLNALFRLIFLEPPTYEKIQSGTPKLRHYLAISQSSKMSKSLMVHSKQPIWKMVVEDLKAVKSFVEAMMRDNAYST